MPAFNVAQYPSEASNTITTNESHSNFIDGTVMRRTSRGNRDDQPLESRPVRRSHRIRLDSRLPASSTRWTCRPDEPALILECSGSSHMTVLRNPKEILRMWDDPLTALAWMSDM